MVKPVFEEVQGSLIFLPYTSCTMYMTNICFPLVQNGHHELLGFAAFFLFLLTWVVHKEFRRVALCAITDGRVIVGVSAIYQHQVIEENRRVEILWITTAHQNCPRF